MSPSLRFLAVALVGWAGLRAATLGAIPGAELFRVAPGEAKPAAITPTEFPPIPPVEAAPQLLPTALQLPVPPQYLPVRVRPVVIPVSVAPPPPGPTLLASSLPPPRPHFYSGTPALDEWPLSRLAAASVPPPRSVVIGARQSIPAPAATPRPHGIDRVQVSAWALLRGRQGAPLGPSSLAAGGTLGGSQAGSRLMYNFTRQIAASVRTSSNIGRRGAEVAAGVRVQPVAGIPLWLTAERRQRIGRLGDGRNAFAFFAEAGLWAQKLPMRFRLDAYLQGGVVGLRSRDKFVDGGLTVTRPIYKRFSGGAGIWGGAQPGVYRLDAGPRVTMRVRNNVAVHFDWRQKLAGNAEPGSGPALTLAGDF